MQLTYTKPTAYFKRVIDNLPPGRLLIVNDSQNLHAEYAKEKGWEVAIAGNSPNSQTEEWEVIEISERGLRCNSSKLFDALFVLPIANAIEARPLFFQTLYTCLQPSGGNLYAVLLCPQQNVPDNTSYSEEEIMPLFQHLEIDIVQESTLDTEQGSLLAWEVSCVKKSVQDNSDSISFSI